MLAVSFRSSTIFERGEVKDLYILILDELKELAPFDSLEILVAFWAMDVLHLFHTFGHRRSSIKTRFHMRISRKRKPLRKEDDKKHVQIKTHFGLVGMRCWRGSLFFGTLPEPIIFDFGSKSSSNRFQRTFNLFLDFKFCQFLEHTAPAS